MADVSATFATIGASVCAMARHRIRQFTGLHERTEEKDS